MESEVKSSAKESYTYNKKHACIAVFQLRSTVK